MGETVFIDKLKKVDYHRTRSLGQLRRRGGLPMTRASWRTLLRAVLLGALTVTLEALGGLPASAQVPVASQAAVSQPAPADSVANPVVDSQVLLAQASPQAATSSTGNQTTAAQKQPAAASAPGEVLQEVVITGTNQAQQILSTSYAVTKMNQDELKSSPALGLAALAQSVPGLYGEASAGEDNLNISPRGVRGGFLEYISLQEDGLPIIYNGFLEEMEVRKDLTYDSLEVIRGGPSGVLTSNGAGAIMNFLSRPAGPTANGEVALTYSDFGSLRTDFFYGTPIGTSGDTSMTFGGYWRGGNGVKPTGYQADHGGQLRATLTKKFENGELFVTYKHIDDHTQFFLPQPVKITQDGSVQRISPIPGFNAEYDYLAGPDTQIVNIKTPNGDEQQINLQDGIWEKSDTLTIRGIYDWENGFKVKDTLRLANINMVDNDLRNLGGNDQIFTASSFLSGPLVTGLIQQFAAQGAVRAELIQVNNGNVIANPAALNGNGLLTEMGSNQYTQGQEEVINDAQLNFNRDDNNVTLGLLTWNVNMDVTQIGVNWLLDVANQAQTMDVAAVNAAGQIVAHLTDNGVLNYDTGYGNGTVHINDNSIYLNDQWHPLDPLRVDAGIRYETVHYGSTSENVLSNVPLGGVVNPNVVADEVAASYGDGTYTSGSSTLSGTAWTVGGNYELTKNFALYARYADSIDTGIANFAVFSPGSSGLPNQMTHLEFGEFGVRFTSSTFYGEVIGYRSTNNHIGIATSNTGGQVFLNNVATGAEFDSRWVPVPILSFDLMGVLQHSEITAVSGSTSFDGNQIDRLPNIEVHFTPTLSTPDGRGSAYLTVSYYGKRWGDLANTLELDPYTDLSAGVKYLVTHNITVSLQGTNLTNEFSITEGNPRGNNVIAGTNAYGFARANLPRVLLLTLDARF
jgi:iron complex outermembrane recepter protein